MRALTLTGLIALAAGLIYIVRVHGSGLLTPGNGAWFIMAARHVVLALTASMVEAVWVVVAIAPNSTLAIAGKAAYNPAYLLNAAISAMAPYLILALLAERAVARRFYLAAVAAIIVVSTVAITAGAARDWSVLMSWTQVLSFVEIAGYLTTFGLVLLGRLRRVDSYFLGLLVILGLYTILLPVQAEFFELVGRSEAVEIWHLNQFLQLIAVGTEIAVVLACINHMRGGRQSRAVSIATET